MIFINKMKKKLKFSKKDQEIFFRSLGFLLKSSITLMESLDILYSQESDLRRKNLIKNIKENVVLGYSLSESCELFPKIFDSVTLAQIKSGEVSGHLSSILVDLSNNMRLARQSKEKIVGILIYPSIIILVGVILVSCLIVFVFPRMISVFQSSSAPLPLFTKIVLNISNFLGNFGLWIFLLILSIAMLARQLVKKKTRARLFSEALVVNIPIIGNIVCGLSVISFLKTIAMLMQSGFTLSEALEISEKNHRLMIGRNMARHALRLVSNGLSFSESLDHSPYAPVLIPNSILQMIKIGEKSSYLAETIQNTIDYYNIDLEEKINRATQFIEPVVMIFIGVIVAVIALSIITPMYSLTQHVYH